MDLPIRTSLPLSQLATFTTPVNVYRDGYRNNPSLHFHPTGSGTIEYGTGTGPENQVSRVVNFMQLQNDLIIPQDASEEAKRRTSAIQELLRTHQPIVWDPSNTYCGWVNDENIWVCDEVIISDAVRRGQPMPIADQEKQARSLNYTINKPIVEKVPGQEINPSAFEPGFYVVRPLLPFKDLETDYWVQWIVKVENE